MWKLYISIQSCSIWSWFSSVGFGDSTTPLKFARSHRMGNQWSSRLHDSLNFWAPDVHSILPLKQWLCIFLLLPRLCTVHVSLYMYVDTHTHLYSIYILYTYKHRERGDTCYRGAWFLKSKSKRLCVFHLITNNFLGQKVSQPLEWNMVSGIGVDWQSHM